MDLRKVDGEKNPADLLTKHSISRHRLEDLVTLFGCRYLQGRAASSPQVRRGESARSTMADADRELGTGRDPESDEPALKTLTAAVAGGAGEAPSGETSPVMPHLVHDSNTLDELYPSLEAPQDESLDDLQCDTSDTVFQHGMRLVERIREETTLQ